MKSKIVLAALALGLLSSTANAATFVTSECKSKTPGCYIVTLKGKIELGDGQAFHDLAQSRNMTNTLLALDSPGGEFEDGLSIANTVRRYKMQTWVGNGWHCESMCSVIWLAGSRHFYQGKAKIGFHGIFWLPVDKQGKPIADAPVPASSGGNAVLGAFYNQLGLSDAAIRTLTEQPPNKMYWLSKDSAATLGIHVEEWQPVVPGTQVDPNVNRS